MKDFMRVPEIIKELRKKDSVWNRMNPVAFFLLHLVFYGVYCSNMCHVMVTLPVNAINSQILTTAMGKEIAGLISHVLIDVVTLFLNHI